MTQQRFLWNMYKCHPDCGICEDGIGTVTAQLTSQVHITHNYKKSDRMEIIFIEDQARYHIDDDRYLRKIIDIYMTHDNVVGRLREFCKEHLKKC